ncbi:MAG: hypothetical protein ACI88C_000349, partial [Acidimicrobiales bacterium]
LECDMRRMNSPISTMTHGTVMIENVPMPTAQLELRKAAAYPLAPPGP